MSENTMNNYSRANANEYQGYKHGYIDRLVDEWMEDYQEQPEERREGVLLPLYLWITQSTRDILSSALEYTVVSIHPIETM
jgi:hypothetical protein